MKRLIATLLMAALSSGAVAGGWSVTYSLASGTVALTNNQANSSWIPVSVMLNFPNQGTGTAVVWRVSQAESFMLGSCVFTNVSTLVWVPDAQYPFGPGEALVIRSSVTNGIVQVIRKGD